MVTSEWHLPDKRRWRKGTVKVGHEEVVRKVD